MIGSMPLPEDGLRLYIKGRHAQSRGEWAEALDAFEASARMLRANADWSLLWRCLLARAALAWRTGDERAATHCGLAARDVAARLHNGWPTFWTCWLLGHIHAARGVPDSAADCFTAAAQSLRTLDDQTLEKLTITAAMLCDYQKLRDDQTLSMTLFDLLRLSAECAIAQDVPLEALHNLQSPPALAPAQSQLYEDGPWTLVSRMRRFYVVPANQQVEPRERLIQPDVDSWRPERTPETTPLDLSTPKEHNLPPETDEHSPDLRAYCLGRFKVFIGDKQVVLGNGTRSKPKTLLKVLVASYPQPVPRDRLLEILWPSKDTDELEFGRSRNNSVNNKFWKQEQEEKLAIQRLHAVVSDLRSALNVARPDAGKWIVAQQDAYGFDERVCVWVDSVVFHKEQRVGQHYEHLERIAEAQTSYERAIALYQGSFLEEDRFADWPSGQRSRLEQSYLDMLARLGQWAFAAGDYAACARWSQALLECDPGHEDIYRQLMRCYSRQGQRGQAMRQYQQCVRALREHHEALPSAETEELYRALQQGSDI